MPGNWYDEKLRWMGPSPYDSSPQVMLYSSTAASLGASSVLCCEESVVSTSTCKVPGRENGGPRTYLDEVGVETLPTPAGIAKRLPRVIISRRAPVQHHTVLHPLASTFPSINSGRGTI